MTRKKKVFALEKKLNKSILNVVWARARAHVEKYTCDGLSLLRTFPNPLLCLASLCEWAHVLLENATKMAKVLSILSDVKSAQFDRISLETYEFGPSFVQ